MFSMLIPPPTEYDADAADDANPNDPQARKHNGEGHISGNDPTGYKQRDLSSLYNQELL